MLPLLFILHQPAFPALDPTFKAKHENDNGKAFLPSCIHKSARCGFAANHRWSKPAFVNTLPQPRAQSIPTTIDLRLPPATVRLVYGVACTCGMARGAAREDEAEGEPDLDARREKAPGHQDHRHPLCQRETGGRSQAGADDEESAVCRGAGGKHGW
jgi:hypothetical protein